jgi:hypothetical protein
VLLVHDDEAERRQRREDGRTRADDHVDLAAADAMPLVVPFTVRESAVLDRQAVGEPRPEDARQRGRQADLGDENQHRAAAVAHLRGQAQVDLRLPAPGHAVQQGGAEGAGPRHLPEAAECHLLLARERMAAVARARGRCRCRRIRLERVTLAALLANADEPAGGETLEHVRGQRAIAEGREIEAVGSGGERGQRVALLRSEATSAAGARFRMRQRRFNG